MTYTFDANIVSDLHKDAYNHRPSRYWWSTWMASTDNEKQSIWDSLLVTINTEIDLDRQAKSEAEGRFGDMITANMRLGASDKIVAIRWILESERISNFDLAYGPDYVSYYFGMGYDTMWKNDIQTAIDSLDIDFGGLYEDDAA